MPQITLKISDNIHLSSQDAKALLKKLHEVLNANKEAFKLDISSCFSGLIREEASYIGYGDETKAKCYFEILWMETAKRAELAPQLAEALMLILDQFSLKLKATQGLNCSPRIRIANLGTVNENYYFSKLS